MQNIIKNINKEIKQISKNFDVKDWDEQKIEHMSSGEAYNRGYYRALQTTLHQLQKTLPPHQQILEILTQEFKNLSSEEQMESIIKSIKIYIKTQHKKIESLIQLRNLIIKFETN